MRRVIHSMCFYGNRHYSPERRAVGGMLCEWGTTAYTVITAATDPLIIRSPRHAPHEVTE